MGPLLAREWGPGKAMGMHFLGQGHGVFHGGKVPGCSHHRAPNFSIWRHDQGLTPNCEMQAWLDQERVLASYIWTVGPGVNGVAEGTL